MMLISYLNNLWEKTKRPKKLLLNEKSVFIILCFFEQIYKFCFKMVCFFKKIKSKPFFSFKALSVGNLSVGGTGKSVFVQFLCDKLKSSKSAVVLRGYKSKNEKTKKSFLVFDGKNFFCDSNFCGDESLMLAQNLHVPVVIGKNRAESCRLLEEWKKEKREKLDFVVLDDAYQNFQVKKDFEILLLDARAPFENNHCLPAGRLREKDYSRANAIILTHADFVSFDDLNLIKKKLKNFNKENIFAGKHKNAGIFHLNSEKIDMENLKEKKFLIFAGIGSFSNFKKSIYDLGVKIFKTLEYPDHYSYSQKDLEFILNLIKDNSLDGAITTQKDWVRLYPLLSQIRTWQKIPIYTSKIEFDFLSREEEEKLLQLLAKTLK